MFGRLGIPLRRYCKLHHRDPSGMSRYLNGKRIPKQDTLDEVLAEVEKALGTPVTQQVRHQLYELHRAALRARDHRGYEFQVLHDRLRSATDALYRKAKEIKVLQQSLTEAEDRLQKLTSKARELESTSPALRPAQSEAEGTRTRSSDLSSEAMTLRAEIRELRAELEVAQQQRASAERRSQELELRLQEFASGDDFGYRPLETAEIPTSADSATVAITILGEVRLFKHGVALQLDKEERTLLAALALSPGQVVPASRLTELLEADNAQTKEVTLATSAAKLGDRLKGIASLRGADNGFILYIDPQRVDVSKFRLLVGAAHGIADDSRKVELLTSALSLWTDPTLDNVASSARELLGADLNEARISAFEERVAAELRLGRQGEVLDELLDLYHQHPMRESIARLLMLAQYRCGDAAGALETAGLLRKTCADHLGAEPSRELFILEQAIRRADPSLDL